MKRKKVFLLVFLCVSGSLTLVQAFFDDSCPKHATFFEASNTTTDCNGAMPISTFGIKGDKFCSNICPDDTPPDTERVFCVLKLWYFTWDPNKFDLKRYRCVMKMEAVEMIP